MKPPAFQFYADDFLGGTQKFTDAETGLYIRLLLAQWNEGGLPDDDQELSSYGKGGTPLNRVRLKFRKCEDGLLRNDRLEAEREKQRHFREKQSQNGKMRWLGIAKPDAVALPSHMPNACSPSPSPSPILDAQTKRETPGEAPHGFPQLETVKAFGQMRGLRPDDCEQFWHHFEASGWVDKNGNPVRKWQSKLMTWKATGQASAKPTAGGTADRILADKELSRVEDRIKAIRNGVEAHCDMSAKDKDELKQLKERRNELKAQLGWKV